MATAKPPASLESAIVQAARPLGGVTNAALAIGRHRHVIAHAANPNKPDMLRLDDAIALDLLCLDAGGGAPILAYYRAALAPEDGPRASYYAHLSALVRESGAVVASMAEALSDNTIDRDERQAILGGAEALRAGLGKLISDLRSEEVEE